MAWVHCAQPFGQPQDFAEQRIDRSVSLAKQEAQLADKSWTGLVKPICELCALFESALSLPLRQLWYNVCYLVRCGLLSVYYLLSD